MSAASDKSDYLDINFRRGSTIYLADPEHRSKGRPRPTLRRIQVGPGSDAASEELKTNEYLD